VELQELNMKRIVALLALALAGCSNKPTGGPPAGMAVKVRAEKVAVQPLEEKISLVASIAANESIEVKSEVDGRVEQINFQEGQRVEEGQLLIKLDERKLAAAVAEAEANFELAKANRDRSQAMMENKTIAQQEFDQALSTYQMRKAFLELARQQLQDSSIHAPFHGLAGARLVSPGQVISKSTPLTTVVDIDPVKVEFRVPERFLGRLGPGQIIVFHVAAYPGEDFRGEVYFVDPQVDPVTRTVLVKALQENKDQRLKPGMFGNLDLILRVKESALLVPESAVVYQGDKTFVYVVEPDGSARQADVAVGTRLAGRAEIVSGVREGDTVVVEGVQKIRPGAKVIGDRDAPAPPAS
jgi:membrane fusion protein (multidrug efflux system)